MGYTKEEEALYIICADSENLTLLLKRIPKESKIIGIKKISKTREKVIFTMNKSRIEATFSQKSNYSPLITIYTFSTNEKLAERVSMDIG